MGFFSLKEIRARNARRAAAAARVKEAVIAALVLSEADAVSVNEIACADPGCPDVETVILVMRAGQRTIAFKIQRPLDEVAASDIAALRAEDRRGDARGAR